MEIVCVGLSHHTAPLAVRELFAIPDGEIAGTAARLAEAPGVSEAVIVSTCNRVEFYVAAEDASQGFAAIQQLAREKTASIEADCFFHLLSARAIQHLFRVVCGLDSMVLGETEILGQVKKAYAAAAQSGATSRNLNKLFQRAFNVAKEVRTKTAITRGAVSVGSVAVELAEKIFGRLAACHVMILGAGETSEMTAGALRARGVKSIFVANRNYDRAATLAATMGGRAIRFEEWATEFAEIDILIGSTSAPHPVLTKQELAPIMRSRPDRPLFCIDLAVPRDIEPAVNDLDGVYVYDIDSLQRIADDSLASRKQELSDCNLIIARHVSEFSDWLAGGIPRRPGELHAAAEGVKS